MKKKSICEEPLSDVNSSMQEAFEHTYGTKQRHTVREVMTRVKQYEDEIMELEKALASLRKYKNWEEDIEKDERHSVVTLYKELLSRRRVYTRLMNTELVLNDML